VDNKAKLLALYDSFPFEHHPLWVSVIEGKLSKEQVLRAEAQHFVRTKSGRELRRQAVERSRAQSETIFGAIIETYLEECAPIDNKPSHLDLVRRLLREGGLSDFQIENTKSTPGTSAAIALYRDIAHRGPACHILGAGAVEHYYSKLAPKVFTAYVSKYDFSEHAAETYSIHGPVDEEHARRAFTILDEAISIHGLTEIELSVRDAFVATSLHYDGMLQAATGLMTYWSGRSK
jgi:pyrroloquinoline quinone (PQQ) biosynthesis protein C